MDVEALIRDAISAGRTVRVVMITGMNPMVDIQNDDDESLDERDDATIAEKHEAMKLKEWPTVLDISHRELLRATSAGALDWQTKGTGRDSRAVMIRGRDIAEYLRCCEAVQNGRITPPSWWSEVRMGEAAEIPEAKLAMAS